MKLSRGDVKPWSDYAKRPRCACCCAVSTWRRERGRTFSSLANVACLWDAKYLEMKKNISDLESELTYLRRPEW
ncbi:hypothetical protein R3I93_007295 [Phoxinus phoxinus]|uniref:Uncharacterized protein n=1 Tax=Phoxinus phoxinus TaxID=58324 RepID=A0AAN9D8H0_9TELE